MKMLLQQYGRSSIKDFILTIMSVFMMGSWDKVLVLNWESFNTREVWWRSLGYVERLFT